MSYCPLMVNIIKPNYIKVANIYLCFWISILSKLLISYYFALHLISRYQKAAELLTILTEKILTYQILTCHTYINLILLHATFPLPLVPLCPGCLQHVQSLWITYGGDAAGCRCYREEAKIWGAGGHALGLNGPMLQDKEIMTSIKNSAGNMTENMTAF